MPGMMLERASEWPGRWTIIYLSKAGWCARVAEGAVDEEERCKDPAARRFSTVVCAPLHHPSTGFIC